MPSFFFPFIVFLFGLVIGSFLNCLIYRLETSESLEGRPRRNPAYSGILRGRSFCDHCKHILSWPDLIPVFSFLFLKGKCRYCSEKISWQYPIIELATGILFLLIIYYTSPNFLFSIFYFLISSFLIIIFVYDLKHYIIPDKVIYPAIIVVLIFNFFTPTPKFGVGAGFLISNQFSIFNSSILSALGAALFFLLIVLLSQGKWMGVGDVKLAILMGFILGWPKILAALFFAFFLGALIGIGLILAGRKTMKSEVPFGPFLVTGTFIAIFWGEKFIDSYLNLFLL